ncbi:MAG: acetolactate synthase small subunit, partial [Pseudomonadota bacterium]
RGLCPRVPRDILEQMKVRTTMSPLNIKKGSSSHSAYELRDPNGVLIESHTLAILVDNESGVLARVIGLFSGRGYNIESLTVAEVDHARHMSRITVVTTGTPGVIEQIKAQLARIVPVHEVHDLTVEGPSVQRELALVKVAGKGEARIEALRLAEIFRANVVDSTLQSFVFEMTGTSEKIDAFADLMRPLGLVEIARTGVAALSRGA